jgi:wyosine [tRNA(Phe)-imidazoG37] synthetase (radical SAM superfamily)
MNLMVDHLQLTRWNGNRHSPVVAAAAVPEAAFEYPRDFLENQFVYLVISARAKGLSIGVNVNPASNCNLHCAYCELDRARPGDASALDTERMASELTNTLAMAYEGKLRKRPRYERLPDELLRVRHVALSGDGEPTLARNFSDVLQTVFYVRALGRFPFFKIVLITNSTQLDQPEVLRGLKYLTREDEVWAKFDGGTSEYLNKINGPTISIEIIAANILSLARQRPVVIQSLFPSINGQEPTDFEIKRYALRLRKLKEDGAEIPLVQIYSANRPMAKPGCGHLPLKTLSHIAQTVRDVAGLPAEVF